MDTNFISSPPLPAASASNKMHVLLVEHDTQHRDNVKNMLLNFSYEVTTFDFPTTALSALSTEGVRFDVMMVDMNSPDVNVFQLITVAMQMDLLVVLMTMDEDSALKTLRALQQGVICIEKPVTMQIFECLWQHVFREKAGRIEAMKHNVTTRFEHPAKVLETIVEPNVSHFEHTEKAPEEAVEPNAKQGELNINGAKDVDTEGNSKKSRKNNSRIQWTDELHEKFMLIVTELGEGRCFPRAILRRMNEPNLTRMQVASHLQICRSSNWKPNKKQARAMEPASPMSTKLRNEKRPRYGAMPLLGTNYQRSNESSYEAYIASSQGNAVSTLEGSSSQSMELSVNQNPVANFQQELDLSYNGSFLSLLLDDHDEIQTATTLTGQWSPNVLQSVNNEATDVDWSMESECTTICEQ